MSRWRPVAGSCLWTLPFLHVSRVERGPDTGHSKVCKSHILETVHNHETRLLHTFIEDKSCVYTARGYTKHLQMTSITRAVKTRVADSVTQQHINILPPSHPPDRMANCGTLLRAESHLKSILKKTVYSQHRGEQLAFCGSRHRGQSISAQSSGTTASIQRN